jgi:peptidoglycan hydrolase-like protein with peptidoglycan-binding domain
MKTIKNNLIFLLIGVISCFTPFIDNPPFEKKERYAYKSNSILNGCLGYIHFHKIQETMKIFYDFLNESRNYDNQGHAESTIRSIQSVLVKLGYLSPKLHNGKDSIDGKFGQATTESLSKYQMENGLLDTKGVINKETLAKMGIDPLVFGGIDDVNKPKTNSENIEGLGNFTPSMYEGAPLVIVFGGISVKERESGDYMYDYFNKTGNRYNLFVAKNHRVNGLEVYNKLNQYTQSHNIYPTKKVLYLFSGGFRPGFQLLKSVSANEFEKIYLVDIWIGKNKEVHELYAQLAKNYPNKVEYYYTGTDSQAGGSANLRAKLEIKRSVAVSKQGTNHMLTNADAVSSLMSYFKN